MVLLYPVGEVINTEVGRMDERGFMVSKGNNDADLLGRADGFCLFKCTVILTKRTNFMCLHR